jgi:starvation-inducible DNA-binding protein
MSAALVDSDPNPAVAAQLQPTLLEMIDLANSAKQAHWNVSGPLFRPLHLEFDDISEVGRTGADNIAERLVAIGVPADGRLATVVTGAGLGPFPPGQLDGDAAAQLIAKRMSVAADRIRERIPLLEDDALSQDVLIQLGRELEKALWMLRVQLP